ncbi:MAG: O-antigen ligase family protein [Gelidibacter sp.]
MKLLRYLVLILILCNIPGIVLVGYGTSAGSFFSYLSFLLLLLFYFTGKRHKTAWPFVLFGICFFVISGLTFIDDEKTFYIDFVKYLLLVICGGELARKTKLSELYILLLVGALSILVNAVFFPLDYGRYSGFYLDPNSAGFLCLIGCALSFGLKNEKWKLIGLFIFTFCGVLTFSRTFFLLWAILILISIFQSGKNLKIFTLGIASIVLLLSVAALLKLNTVRLSMVDSVLNNNASEQTIEEGSRRNTWAMYYDRVFESPILGNGYQTFTGAPGVDNNSIGVHNNYLRIIGEAGVLPFFIFIAIYVFLLVKSLKTFKSKVHLTLLAISLLALHLTNHNFDTISHVTFVSIWLYFRLTLTEDNPIEEEQKQLSTL